MIIRIVLVWLFILISTLGHTKDVSLSWDASPSDGIEFYSIHWDNQPTPPFANTVMSGNVLNYLIANLPDDKEHWFAVTAHDGFEHSSVYSNIVNSPSIEPEPLPIINFTTEWELIEGR